MSLHIAECELCGDQIGWDDTPNPRCEPCAAGHINLDRLKAALEWCSEIVFTGMDIDGGDFQDGMVEMGLLVAVPSNDEYKAMYGDEEMLDWIWK